MDTLRLSTEIRVFGIQVQDCPNGIGAAFDKLASLVEGGFNRPYYGICEMKNGGFVYRAAAHEMYEGEGQKYKCEPFTIEKGDYLAVTVHEWRKNTESINDVFRAMMGDQRVDGSKLFVEWYKDDEEMVCMVRVHPSPHDKNK